MKCLLFPSRRWLLPWQGIIRLSDEGEACSQLSIDCSPPPLLLSSLQPPGLRESASSTWACCTSAQLQPYSTILELSPVNSLHRFTWGPYRIKNQLLTWHSRPFIDWSIWASWSLASHHSSPNPWCFRINQPPVISWNGHNSCLKHLLTLTTYQNKSPALSLPHPLWL